MAGYIITGALLGICTYTDLRQQAVYRIVLLVFAAAAVIFGLAGRMENPAAAAAGLFPGACCLLTGLLTKEAIGLGDGWVLCIIGLCLGPTSTLRILSMGLFCAGVFALILILLKKDTRRRFAFLPFLSMGYLWDLYSVFLL